LTRPVAPLLECRLALMVQLSAFLSCGGRWSKVADTKFNQIQYLKKMLDNRVITIMQFQTLVDELNS
jgi:hypothetical protein